MLKDFDKVTTQLQQLAPVINSFKSEAVQLRIVELLFGGQVAESVEGSDDGKAHEHPKSTPPTPSKRKTRPRKAQAPNPGSEAESSKPARRLGRKGAMTLLRELVDDGFFSEPRTIGEMIEQLSTHKARQFKASDLSGKLVRLVREKSLSRKKNADGQYEYSA